MTNLIMLYKQNIYFSLRWPKGHNNNCQDQVNVRYVIKSLMIFFIEDDSSIAFV